MEVHPPEHGIHSWRDFLVHMGTITLGLVIALGLEAAAEALHPEVQHYADIYSQQDEVKQAARDYVMKQVHLVTPLMRRGDMENGTVRANLSPSERQALADNSAESLTQIGLLMDLTNGLTDLYNDK